MKRNQNTFWDILPDEVWMFEIARRHLMLVDIAQARHVCWDWRRALGPVFLEGFIQGADSLRINFQQSKRLNKKGLDRIHLILRSLQTRLQGRKAFRHPLNFSFPCYETYRLCVSLAQFFELQIDAIDVPQGKWYERIGEPHASIGGCPYGGCEDCGDVVVRNAHGQKLWTYEQQATVYRPVRLLLTATVQKSCHSLLEPTGLVWLKWKKWEDE